MDDCFFGERNVVSTIMSLCCPPPLLPKVVSDSTTRPPPPGDRLPRSNRPPPAAAGEEVWSRNRPRKRDRAMTYFPFFLDSYPIVID